MAFREAQASIYMSYSTCKGHVAPHITTKSRGTQQIRLLHGVADEVRDIGQAIDGLITFRRQEGI